MIILSSDRIRDLREKNNYTQSTLAARLGITRASVNAWEMGLSSPSAENLAELSKIFHVSTDYILGVTNDEMVSLIELEPDEKELIYRMLRYFEKVHQENDTSDK